MIQLSLVPEEDLTIDGRAVIEDQDGNMVALVEDRKDAVDIVNACRVYDSWLKTMLWIHNNPGVAQGNIRMQVAADLKEAGLLP